MADSAACSKTVQMWRPNRTFVRCGGLTLIEFVMALAIMTIIFAAIFPLFRTIRTNWDSKAGAAETLQNARVLIDHVKLNLSEAIRITAVSRSSNPNGYIEFQDTNRNIMRYGIDDQTGYVQFGRAGGFPSNLAGPVTSLRFMCYDANDLQNPIPDVGKIRLVEMLAAVKNPAEFGKDSVFRTKVYLRTNSQGLNIKVDIGAGGQVVAQNFTPWSVGAGFGTVGPQTLDANDVTFVLSTPLSSNLGFRTKQGHPVGRDFVFPAVYDPVNIDNNKLVLTIQNLPQGLYSFKGWHNVFWLQQDAQKISDPNPVDVQVSGAVQGKLDDLFVPQTRSPWDLPHGSLGESNVTFRATGKGDVLITFTPR